MVFCRGALVPSVMNVIPFPVRAVGAAIGRGTQAGHRLVKKEGPAALAEKQQLIADIMGAQQKLQDVIAEDRADPLFSSHLTLSQLRILMLVARHGSVSGSELAGMVGIGAAALTGMIDRLVVQDLVARAEDPHDRRVRRIALTRAGKELIASIFNAGEEKMRTLLSRLSAEELEVVAQATALILKAADSGQP